MKPVQDWKLPGFIKKILANRKLMEFIRYCFVGGVSFIFDWLTIKLFYDIILPDSSFKTTIATAAGFIIGLIVNYILSLLIVFTTKTQQKQGKTFYAFAVFAVIGIVGLVIKTILMNIGVDLLGINYNLFNIPAAGIVLIWNYIARKKIIFKEK